MGIRTLFIGTGGFAVTVLQALIASELVDVVGVITQPDKPFGRKQELRGGPLMEFIRNDESAKNLKIYQPEKLRLEAEQILNETTPELIIVAAYGQMIPDVMLTYPKYKCLNLHGSLLPQLRGAVPVQMAILNGLEATGITIQEMVKELDAGPIVAVERVDIAPDETSESLMSKLAEVGSELLIKIIPDLIAGKIQFVEQDHSQATFCYQADIAKEKAEITFEMSVKQAERMIRAFYPWPVAWVNYSKNEGEVSQMLKIFKATPALGVTHQFQKLAIFREGKKLYLALNDGTIELEELQLEGKNKRQASHYLFLE